MILTRAALTATVAAAVLTVTASPAHADTPITFVSPVFHQATCTSPATIDIPNVPGVEYSLDYIPSGAGHYTVDYPGLHVVNAFPFAQVPGFAEWDYTTVNPTAAQCAPPARPGTSPIVGGSVRIHRPAPPRRHLVARTAVHRPGHARRVS